MSDLEPNQEPTTDSEPWWNDGDRVGGLVATIIMLTFSGVVVGLAIWFLLWLF